MKISTSQSGLFHVINGVSMLVITLLWGIVCFAFSFPKESWFPFIGILATLQVASWIVGVVAGVENYDIIIQHKRISRSKTRSP